MIQTIVYNNNTYIEILSKKEIFKTSTFYNDYYVISSDLVEYFKNISNKIVISKNTDTINYLNKVLKDKHIKNLHIISHANNKFIDLGKGLTSENVKNINNWNVDNVNLWCCNIGANLQFVNLLEKFTNSTVISSSQKLGMGNTLENSNNTILKETVRNLDINLVVILDSIDGSINSFITNNTAPNATPIIENIIVTGTITVSQANALSNLTTESAYLQAQINSNSPAVLAGLNPNSTAGVENRLFITVGSSSFTTATATQLDTIMAATRQKITFHSGFSLPSDWNGQNNNFGFTGYIGDFRTLDSSLDAGQEGGVKKFIADASGHNGRIIVTGAITVLQANSLSNLQYEIWAQILDNAMTDLDNLVNLADTLGHRYLTITLGESITVSQANVLSAKTYGVITATISNGDISTLKTLTDEFSNNVYTITITDSGSAAASDINSIKAGNTKGTITANTFTTVTGSIEDVILAYAAVDNGFGNIPATINDTDNSGNGVSIAALNTLDGLTTGTINAGTITAVKGTPENLLIAYRSSEIAGLGNEEITISGLTTITQANALNDLNDGVIIATINPDNYQLLMGLSGNTVATPTPPYLRYYYK